MPVQPIDPILSLAISVQNSPGIYALLVGSGVSRTANIPTGWEVVLDLTEKLAAIQKEDCKSDPAAWYYKKFGEAPDYSKLLHAICKTPSERQQLLRSYFEPNDEEREQGLKQPTLAHRAIAKLVVDGYVRVVITTNLDRLIERAIDDEGMPPTVVSSPDAIEGALPLAHQKRCVVKLHGDYLDSRIKNTPTELAEYDNRLNRLLDQVLDSFGLIVCGWSSQWDTALRAAIERCPSRRFTTFWTTRGRLTEEAKQVIRHRNAEVIPIDDADTFFGKLAELVGALTESNRQHPTSAEAAVALIKRYLPDTRYRIQLDDLVATETEKAHVRIEAYNEESLKTKPQVERIFQGYREILEVQQAVMVHGVAHGNEEQDYLWIAAIERIARYDKENGEHLRVSIAQYPALILVYSAGLTAVCRQRYKLFAKLITEPRYKRYSQIQPLLTAIEYGEMHDFTKTIKEHIGDHLPVSEHLFSVLREPLRRFLPDNDDYDDAFDRFEYLRALIYADVKYDNLTEAHRFWVPPGRFCWKYFRRGQDSIVKRIDDEIQRSGDRWQLIQLGLFKGSLKRLKEIKENVDEFVGRLQMS